MYSTTLFSQGKVKMFQKMACCQYQREFQKKYWQVAFLFFIVSFSICTMNLKSQTFQESYNHVYPYNWSDSSFCVAATRDGGYIMAGTTFDATYSPASEFIMVVKTDASGTVTWDSVYVRGTVAPCRMGIRCIREIADGYILAGYCQGDSSGNASLDAFLLKIDLNGIVQWDRYYGITMNASPYYDEEAYSVRQTNDGGFILVGYAHYDSTTTKSVYVIKTNSLGYPSWQNVYLNLSLPTNAEARDVLEIGLDGYIVTGWMMSSLGNTDVFAMKISSIGALSWLNLYGGTQADSAFSIVQGAVGDTNAVYLIAGSTQSFGAGGSDAFVMGIRGDGTFQWAKSYGGKGNDGARCITSKGGSKYVFLGYSNSFRAPNTDNNLYAVEIDASTTPAGNPVWSKIYGGNNEDVGNYLVQTSDGGFVMTGSSYQAVSSTSKSDYYLVKTDAYGVSCSFMDVPSIFASFTPIILTPSLVVRSFGFNNPMGTFYANHSLTIAEKCHVCPTDSNSFENPPFVLQPTFQHRYGTHITDGSSIYSPTYNLNYETFHAHKQTSDSGYIAVGATFSSISEPFSATDHLGTQWNSLVYIVKTQSNGSVQWAKTYFVGTDSLGDYGAATAVEIVTEQDSTQSYVVAGYSNSLNGFIMKINSSGTVVWHRGYANTRIYGMIKVADGFVAVGHNFNQTTPVGFAAKVDLNGGAVWAYSYPINNTYDTFTSIAQASSGDFIIIGYYGNGGLNTSMIRILKISSDGTNVLWSKISQLQGDIGDIALKIKRTSDDMYVIVGSDASSRSSSMQYNRSFVLKIDDNSNVIWFNNYYEPYMASQFRNYGVCYDIVERQDGFVIVGRTACPSDTTWLGNYIAQISLDGDPVWMHTLRNDWMGYNLYSSLQSVAVDKDGGLSAAGKYEDLRNFNNNYYDAFLVKMGKLGQVCQMECESFVKASSTPTLDQFEMNVPNSVVSNKKTPSSVNYNESNSICEHP